MRNSTRMSAPFVLLSSLLTAVLTTVSVGAAPLKLTGLIGHPVETDSGDRLGNIEDFSVDATTGRIDYVVVSVGSFLIENSLIAVEPNALSQAASGDPLVLRIDDLEIAHRFNADSWPQAADVRTARRAGADSEEGGGTSDSGGRSSGSDSAASAVLSSTGTATITSGKKKATFEDGRRELINGPLQSARKLIDPPEPAAPKSKAKRTVLNFKNLDRNRDGRLSRAEIGAQLSQRSGFTDLDIDANGSIDDFEYEAYVERMANQRRWVGNR